MSEKTLNNIRVINKHDLEENWLKATGFTPKQGELIVYDIDDNYSYERIKIGDGVQNVNALPFVDDALRETLLSEINEVDDKVDTVSTLVGNKSVSTQIADAIKTKAEVEHTHDAVFLKALTANLPSSENWNSVVYGGDKFVAVAKGSDQAAYSTDGIAWTLTPLPSYAQWCAVAYGYGRFMTVAYGSNKAAYSLDGITWQESTMPTSGDWCGIAYADGPGFVTIGQLSDTCVFTTTGIGWSTSTLPAYEYWTDITSDGNTIVAIAQAPNVIISTMDAYTWDQHSTAIYSGGLTATTYGGDKFVAISSGDGEACYTGANGRWYATTIGTRSWRDVAYGGDKFVAVADGTDVASYSTDGITWLETTMPVSADWRCISYGNGVFTAIAYDSDIVVFSYDGIVWHQELKALQDKDGNDASEQIKELLGIKTDSLKLTTVTLPAAGWTGSSNPWSQVVMMNGVTDKSKVDLNPTAIQVVEMQNNDIALMAENDDGVITVYAIGSKPTVDYTMQALITEVTVV